MKRSGAVKFPNSVQLFKFCQKVLMAQKGGKVHDQEVGSILNFNPSDCSHWKRGEKNVRSVFSLAKLAETLQLETTLVHDLASGAVGLDEAYYEWQESNAYKSVFARAAECPAAEVGEIRRQSGEYREAVKLLSAGAVGTAFDKLDRVLGKAMEQSRHELRDDILNARRGLTGATVGGVVLSLGAALAVALGLWPRLSEYR